MKFLDVMPQIRQVSNYWAGVSIAAYSAKGILSVIVEHR